ncbi:hypothetical protein GOP47_0004297 [Adiantum capillus-veneris]|uniref:Uncharacterized protein n=1 Tax=Adiantum capillus-veneris TaxID=13818 RepID=A0A9D4ZMQ6_ADICA|nr:hypothetical protein GOP47_0004297 [Adiantum capillus-veneris]
MEVSTEETGRAEASELDEPPTTSNSEKSECSEEDIKVGDGGRSNPLLDSFSADEESIGKNAAGNSSQDSSGLSVSGHGDREIVPAFVTARSLVPEDFLRQEKR